MTVPYLGCFDEFFIDDLARLRRELEGMELPAGAVDGLLETVMRRVLVPIACRTLIHEFRLHWLNGAPEQHDDRYRAFADALQEPCARRAIRMQYPELDRLLTARVSSITHLVGTALDRLAQDRPELSARGLHLDEIVSMTLCASDPHNGGQSVVAFEGVRDGLPARLIYKPRPVDVDVMIEDLVQSLTSPSGPLQLRPVTSVARDGYGWQEYVEQFECGDIHDVRSCFRSAGQWLALFHILGATDLHYENVICSGAHLRFIDLETALCHITPSQFEGVATHNTVINQSVLGTMLLPGAIANSVFDVSIAGLGSSGSQKSPTRTTFDIGGLGTNGISFQRIALNVEHSDNLVILDGEVQSPAEYADEIESGYAEALDYVVNHLGPLTDVIKRRPSTTVRKVLRPTAIYSQFIDASLHPRYLRSGSERERLLRLIEGSSTQFDAGHFPQVHSSEVRAMSNLDVPYFSCEIGSVDLWANRDERIVGYFSEAPAESLLSHLRNQAVTNTTTAQSQSPSGRFNRGLIHQSMSTSDPFRPKQRTGSKFLSNGLVGCTLKDRAEYVAGYLLDVRQQDDTDHNYWITPRLAGERWVLDKCSPTLMDGGGIAAFLHDYGVSLDASEPAAIARRYWLDTIRPTLSGIVERGDASLFTGMGSYLALAARFADTDAIAAAGAAATSLMHHLPGTDGLYADFTNGWSGLGYIVCAVTESGSPARTAWQEVAERAADLIGSALDRGDFDGMGELAHGDAGMRLGVSAWNHLIGATNHTEMPVAPAPQRPGWCRGHHGSLLASVATDALNGLCTAAILERHQSLIQWMIDAPARQDATVPDIALCHGWAGEADALASVAQHLQLPELLDRTQSIFIQRLDRLTSTGYTCGTPYSAGVPSFLLGMAGVGSTMLRLATDGPSPLMPPIGQGPVRAVSV